MTDILMLNAELDALRQQKEAKIAELTEKRKGVEALKQQRQEKWAQSKRDRSPEKKEKVQPELNKLEDLLKDICGDNSAPPPGRASQKSEDAQASPKREFQRAQTTTDLSKVKNFTVNRVVAREMVAPVLAKVCHQSCQSDMTGEEVAKAVPEQKEDKHGKSCITYLMKMAEQARFRQGHDPQALRMHAAAHAAEHPKKDEEKEEAAWMKVQPFSTEESEKICETEDFQKFFEAAVELVERELGVHADSADGEVWDCACDWNVLGGDANKEGESLDIKHIKFQSDFIEDKWSRGRPITEVRNSPHSSETILVGYGERLDAAPTEPDGCVLLWNLGAKDNSRLQNVFTAPSQVMTAHFHRFDPNLFFGGLVSGGIVMWDARVGSIPVQDARQHSWKRDEAHQGHRYAIQAMQHIGTQGSSNLVSGSSDGRVCVWDLAKLDVPQATVDLQVPSPYPEAKAKDPVSLWSLQFPENENSLFYVGAEDGSMYQAHLKGDKAGIVSNYTGHEGPVAGISLHPRGNLEYKKKKEDIPIVDAPPVIVAPPPAADGDQPAATDAEQPAADGALAPPTAPGPEASVTVERIRPPTLDTSFDLALTCSFDWSIKLWMVNKHQNPVLAFETFDDYVYDVRWHPTHPAVFASVDGEGHVALWNLIHNLESPLMTCENPNGRKLALNRCDWSLDGRRLAVGDSEGTLSVFGVHQSVSEPRREEFGQFQERVRSFQPYQFERSQIPDVDEAPPPSAD